MLSLDLMLSTVAVAAFHAVLLLTIPFLPLAAGSRLINAVQRARLPITPAIETAALLVGVVVGAMLLATHTQPASFDVAGIFTPGGYWDIPVERFLLDRASPANYPLFDVLLPAQGGIAPYAPLVAALAVGILPLAIGRSAAGIANGARNLLIVLWAAYATVYLVCLLFWLLALLNFWSFLVALLLVQTRRRR